MAFDKSFLKSKTLWLSLITIIGGFFPAVQEFTTKNPEMVVSILGGLFGLLRIQTDTKLVTPAKAKSQE